jgi:hypothetical protein
MNKLRCRAAGLALALTVTSASLLSLGLANASATPAAGATTRQIAASTLSQDFRATLTAIRSSGTGGGPPAATVELAVYQRTAGKWKLTGQQVVGAPNSWFWKVVTSDGGICLFSTSSLSPYPIQVRPLVDANIGCSAVTYNFHLDKYGDLVSG